MTARPELLERDAETAVLAELADRARAGGGSCVVVAGTAGIGKTALLGRGGELAGMRVLRASGGELEDDVPFGVVRDALGPIAPRDEAALSGSAALCAPVFDPGAGAVTEAGAVLHGLYWLVADVAEREPLALVIDDVQWADPSSVRFLGYLARRAADLPCLLVLGLRAGQRTRLRSLRGKTIVVKATAGGASARARRKLG